MWTAVVWVGANLSNKVAAVLLLQGVASTYLPFVTRENLVTLSIISSITIISTNIVILTLIIVIICFIIISPGNVRQ